MCIWNYKKKHANYLREEEKKNYVNSWHATAFTSNCILLLCLLIFNFFFLSWLIILEWTVYVDSFHSDINFCSDLLVLRAALLESYIQVRFYSSCKTHFMFIISSLTQSVVSMILLLLLLKSSLRQLYRLYSRGLNEINGKSMSKGAFISIKCNESIEILIDKIRFCCSFFFLHFFFLLVNIRINRNVDRFLFMLFFVHINSLQFFFSFVRKQR